MAKAPDDHSNVIVRLAAAAGMMNTYWQVVVSETKDGGAEVAAEVSVQDYDPGRSEERIRRLSAKEVSAGWASLEPLAWWRLADAGGGPTDQTFLTVFLRNGGRRLDIKCYGAPPEPQRTLVESIEELGGIRELFAQISKRGSAKDP